MSTSPKPGPKPPQPLFLTALQWIAALSAVPVTTLEEARFVIEEIALEANKALAQTPRVPRVPQP